MRGAVSLGDGIRIDTDSGRVVYSRNVDGYTELTVGDLDGTEIEEYPTPDLPRGTAGGVSYGPDGETFAVTATAADDNANVYVVDVATGEAEQWTAAATAGIPRESFRSPELVRYESFDGLEVPAFFSRPDGDGPFRTRRAVRRDQHRLEHGRGYRRRKYKRRPSTARSGPRQQCAAGTGDQSERSTCHSGRSQGVMLLGSATVVRI